MTTPRRTLLGALIAAPVIGTAPVAAAQGARDLCERDTNALLDDAARNDPDREFALLCAAAFHACQETKAAFWDYERARTAAEAETPPYPEGLCYRSAYTSLRGHDKGRTYEYDLRCDPRPEKREYALTELAQWRVLEVGGTVEEAKAHFRAEHAAWVSECEAAQERHNVAGLLRAYQGTHSAEALAAVMAYPARSPRTLLTKLRLRAAEYEWPRGSADWDSFIDEAERALA